MSKSVSVENRDAIAAQDKWAIEKIFKTVNAWQRAVAKVEKEYPAYKEHTKSMTQSAKELAALLQFDEQIEKQLEKIGSYAFLLQSADLTNTTSQELVAKYSSLATRIQEAASFITPKILSIPSTKMDTFLNDPVLKEFRITLQKIIRQKKHILTQKEERVLALQGELSGSAGNIFRKLNDTDFCFGTVNVDGKDVELTQSTYGLLLESPNRRIRKNAFNKMCAQYTAFENTLAETYNSSVLEDVYHAKVRNFSSAQERSLFKDDVPATVYDNLIKTIRENIHINHRYLDLHKRVLKLRDLHFYDSYVPLVSSVKWNSGYEQAVDTIIEALAPLGRSYCNTLKKGLTTWRWVDKYENKGKRSGAFSAGGYEIAPYILMNFKPKSLQSVYTLAHEAGHSMHTFYSAKYQNFSNYDYAIFVAEVASTFNEQLLTEHLLNTASNKNMKAYIIDREINQIRATMIRQTMFAEFEKRTHEIVESQEALTVSRLKNEYSDITKFYFGPNFKFDDALAMEWARIPHFYSAFYVYKYATGISAATTLCQKVLQGNSADRDAYLSFLKSGASKFPLETLKDAGADLTTPQPVEMMMKRFSNLIDNLETLL